MRDNGLTPRAKREVAETNWTDAKSVKKLEAAARVVFGTLMVGQPDTTENKTRARNWTVGALVGAFPRKERADVRLKVEELVARVTGDAPSLTKHPGYPFLSMPDPRKRAK
jgi:hypothetical protein